MGSDIASLIAASDSGDRAAAEKLFSILYAELRAMAKRELARQGGNISLGASTLLHQAYLDMAERTGAAFADQARFMAYACRVMRGLIIDHVRSRQAQKRGGQFEITSFGTDVAETIPNHTELARVSEALDELAKFDAPLSELVDLKFFCGFSFSEIAAMRGISERTAQRDWERARIYLHRSIRPDLEL